MNTSEKIISAIVSMKKLRITYKGDTESEQYTVQAHLLGKLKSTNNIALSAWFDSEIKGCWKTFLLSNITDAELLEEGFEHTATGYNPKDKRMATIICSIPTFR